MFASVENIDIENAAHKLRAMGLHSPSPDVVHARIGELSEMEVIALFQRISEEQLARRKLRRLLKKGVDIAIDLHERRTWSRASSPFICPSDLHEGTGTAYRMISLEVVVPGIRLTLANLPITALANRPKIILGLLLKVSHYATMNNILIDRGFFSASLLDELTRAGFTWLMPIPGSESIKEHLSTIRGFSWWVGEWTIRESGGKRSATFTLVVMDDIAQRGVVPPFRQRFLQYRIRKKAERADGHTTEETPEVRGEAVVAGDQPACRGEGPAPTRRKYDGRRGIETGYRIQEGDFEIHTKTRLPASRLFLWLFQFAMYELWRLTNILREARDRAKVLVALDTGEFVLKLEAVPGILKPLRIPI